MVSHGFWSQSTENEFFQIGFYPIRTDQGAMKGYCSLGKRLRSKEKLTFKIHQKLEKNLMISSWLLVKIHQNELFRIGISSNDDCSGEQY